MSFLPVVLTGLSGGSGGGIYAYVGLLQSEVGPMVFFACFLID